MTQKQEDLFFLGVAIGFLVLTVGEIVQTGHVWLAIFPVALIGCLLWVVVGLLTGKYGMN